MPQYARPVVVPGVLITKIRHAHGLTQVEFAERMNVTRRTIIRWEGYQAVLRKPVMGQVFTTYGRLERLARDTGLKLPDWKAPSTKRR